MTKKDKRQSVSTEDYLKAIYRLTRDASAFASNAAIASALRISAPSVTGMLRKLAKNRLVNYSPYNGAKLTHEGTKRAVRILRRHRLLELFLHKCLRLSWNEIHQEAEVLEHVLSERLESEIDNWLGHPRFDPHGAPIPDAAGFITPRKVTKLSELEARQAAVVAHVVGNDSDLLSYFEERRIFPNRRIIVLDRGKFGGSLKVRVAGKIQYIGLEAAQQVMVEQL